MLWIIASFAIGGILKGATGAGAPLFAVPALTALYGVEFAIAVFVVPNLLSNLWQGWTYRREALPPLFLLWFCGMGMVGVVGGTWLLATLDERVLALTVAGGVFAYIALRLMKPGFIILYGLALRLSPAVGLASGLLQGTAGISAPVTLSFLSAMRIERLAFVGTIAIFFVSTALAQIPALFHIGALTPERLLIGFGGLLLIGLFMPVGAWLGRRFSARTFERVILFVLGLLALRIILDL